ncbi:MAG: hypothetical protein RR877_01330 [Aurantimicrobium sp.]|uniref:hypothetical protein n=1 Tax=Aurantimicrobium sp. TaxID=1930784 RepID=UPI002FCC9E8A
MLNSDLNSIIGLHNNNPEIFEKEYYIVERGLDGRIKAVHAYSKKNKFEMISVANGQILIVKKPSHLNMVVENDMGPHPDVVIDLLESITELNQQSFSITEVSKFELLDLTKTY